VTKVGTYRVIDEVVTLTAHRWLAPVLRVALADLAVEGRPSAHMRTSRRNEMWSIDYEGADGAPPSTVAAATDSLAFYEILRAFNSIAGRRAAANGLALHASAVEIDGAVIAFSGPSGAGKSTMAGTLAIGGCGYVSDEVVAVRDGDLVHPYHRPVGLRPGGAAVLGVDVPVGPYDDTYPLAMGRHAPLSTGGPLACIVLVERHDASVEIEHVDQSTALVQLAGLTLGSTGLERETFRRLDHLVRRVPVRRLRYRDAPDVREHLGALRNP
jgi:hypothetical protein